MREAWLFCGLVWSHWKINLTGGSLMALLFLWQIAGKSVPWWVYAAIAASTLFISCFLAWRAEYRAHAEGEKQLAGEKERRLRAEQQLAEEKANKLTVNDIVLREAREGFRNLKKEHHSSIAPRALFNEQWVQMVAEKHGKTIEEINEAIDRLDGKFHWQG